MVMNRFSAIFLSIFVLGWAYFFYLGHCRQLNLQKVMITGDSNDCMGFQNSVEIESFARFAVQEHNKRQNALLEFVRALKAKEQVVAGKLYYLTLEAIDGGHKKMYEAKVWVKPWMNFKQLEEFKHAESDLSLTPSDLGVTQDGHGSGWRAVPTKDPEVQDAANHAVKFIQQRSNSLSPYELMQILKAKAKLIKDYAKFDLLLKVRSGIKEENFGVEVTKDKEGKFYLN
uniref:Cysteine proteinase inhibitor n=1 Tax=Hevea brasiliensis TaxID=3981 RepID=A0A1W5LK44_HEVBR|nr:cysteine proteinase inhibitor [Hevea brasiliensis]